MAIDLSKTLRKALGELQAEQEKISRQIAMIQRVLGTDTRGPQRGRSRVGAAEKPAQRHMSAAARKAVSRRMKAYWAKRKADATKGKGQGSK
jgi:hypothetical protein